MRILGVDGGIASVGWAVVDIEAEERQGKIVAAGTWMFDSPEEATQSGPKLKNEARRTYRGQRHVIHRRAQRMQAIRALFKAEGLIASADRTALAGKDPLSGKCLDPWELRAEGLDRHLDPREWAIALGHIAIHRGFRSNKKGERANAPAADKETKSFFSGMESNHARLEQSRATEHQYRTIGEMFARDPDYAMRRRNRAGSFSHSVYRKDQEDEVRALFAAQKRLGNLAASDAFRDAFMDMAFSQRPLQSSEEKVGPCPFEPGERRTARFAPGFEKFRLYSRLAALRLQTGRSEQSLSREQIAGFPPDYGATAKLTYGALRKYLDLGPNTRFAGVSREDEKSDIAARHGSALAGTAKFRKVLEPAIGALETRKLLSETLKLDRAAEIITFNEDTSEIRRRLAVAGLSEAAHEALAEAVERGEFDDFKGAGHISAKAAANIVPGLMEGMVYSEACARVGYDHAASAVNSIKDVTSPVARKALTEMLKQIRTLERAFGNRNDGRGKRRFDRIHLEMARDIGKSIDERGRMERGIERRNAEKERLRSELREMLKIPDEQRIRPDDLLRYELWKEQNGRCLYSDEVIAPEMILSTDNQVQVDHILPWSRFGDDSYRNKTLCFVKANAEKGGRTPFEWLGGSPEKWGRFSAAVENNKQLRGFKKRNYLLRNANEVEEKFRNRNLNDTRYALRALLAELGRQYHNEADGSLRVFARPGELTSKLRQAWGVEALKKAPDGKRLPDDRHHALDAMVLAVTTNSLLQLATRASQQAEARGDDFNLRGLCEPWDGFRKEAEAVFKAIFVARQEIRRERGKAHDATIKQIRTIDGEGVVFERKPVEKLTLKDLGLIPTPEPYGKIAAPKKLRDEMVAALRAWIDAGKPKDSPPRSPKGDVIRKVRVRSTSKPALLIRGGTVDRGDMVRVDVFSRPNRKGKDEYFLVPVYLHEVATCESAPVRAVQAYADESAWPIMGTEFAFAFTLYPMSLVEVVARDGEVKVGYFRGLDRSTGAFAISLTMNSSALIRSIGARTLPSLKKLRVDRLGKVREVKREVRLWHGKECISQGPQGSALPIAS